MKRFISLCIIASFIASSIVVPQRTYAQELSLPVPGAMVNLSPAYVPVLVKGLKVHPENPLLFDFILDTGNSGLKVNSPEFKVESQKLIKYFLASLTIKEDDMWVNLSPYEKDRIVPNELGKTELGRDMLAQDYILKQLTASLIYPEKQLGKEFWNKIYAKAQQMYGASDVPVNTFNKVWIIADKAKILERNNVGYVVGSHLKVMLEEDYMALEKHTAINKSSDNKEHTTASQIVREIILPELEKEVNQGQNFAPLRQMFYSMILASWYKLAIKDALLNQVYSNKNKTGGVLSDDPAVKEKIYEQYLKAYKKGVFNYIKDDVDTLNKQPMPRKYFSGGLRVITNPSRLIEREKNLTSGDNPLADGDLAMAAVNMAKVDHAMIIEKANVHTVDRLIKKAMNEGSDNRVVLIVNTPFSVSNEAVIGFLNSGRNNVVALKGLQGVLSEFYFDGHPKAVGVPRNILNDVGIQVPEDGVLDPWAEQDRTELKSKILQLKNRLNLPLAEIERLEQKKFETLKATNGQKIKISSQPFIFDQGDTIYANLHILDLRIKDKLGRERVIRTYQNSPVITDEVEILGVGPETIKVWRKIIEGARNVIIVGDDKGFEGVLQESVDGQTRIYVDGNDTESMARLSSQDTWRVRNNANLSVQELSLLREADEANGFISKRARDDQRITKQIVKIETALGTDESTARSKATEIITALNKNKLKFKGEEVHILNGTGASAKVIGRVDRNIAEKYGYIHETANVVLITPDGKVLLQLRNKKNYDDHLAMYGGHLGVGESHSDAVVEETTQETGLSALEASPVFVGYEGYNMPGDSNRERRSWFVKVLTSFEYEQMKASELSEESRLGINKINLTRDEYKKALFDAQESRKDGSGEVVGTYAFTFEELAKAATSLNPSSPFEDKTNRFIPVTDKFNNGEESINAFFTPDSLDQLLSAGNRSLWESLQKVADEERMVSESLVRSEISNRFKQGGDVVGLHDLPFEQSQEGVTTAIKAGLIPELKGSQETAIVRGNNPKSILAQTVKPGQLVAAVQAGANILIASEMLNQNEIIDARRAAEALGGRVVIIAGIDTTQPNVEGQISMAVANGTDGVKFKPAGKGQEVNTQKYIEYAKKQHPNLIVMVAGGVSAANRDRFAEAKAGMGAGTIDEIKAIAQWAKTVQDSAQTVIPTGGIDLNVKNMGLEVAKDGQGVEMKFDPAMVAEFQRGDFSGIVPVIIRITSISSALPILGL